MFLLKSKNSILHFIDTHNLISEKSSIVVGFSGGPDSVFLLHYLVQLKKEGRVSNLIAAHLNHGWRTESDQDQAWCTQLCKQLNVPFVSAHLSDYEKQIKFDGSKEAFARTARRMFFEQVRMQHDADTIALAHHLQDQEETFFIRLVRGTSLTGLTCMWPKNGYYIRPLLQTNKNEILAYLDKHKIKYLIDPTNADQDFLRNRIRTHVLPAMHNADDRFDHNFLQTLNRLQETERYLQIITQETFESISNRQSISIEQFLAQPSIMQYRLLAYWLEQYTLPFAPTQAVFDEIIRFLKQPGSKSHTLHPKLRITKEKKLARIDT